MIALFWITVLYVIPFIVLRHLTRKLAIINGVRLTMEVFVINITPILNIIVIPILAADIAKKKNRSTFIETFYGIRRENAE